MIYKSAADWYNDPQKKVLMFGMSGLGKTHVSNMLRANGDWFHYSIDYRIGTRYMGEAIDDNLKREAMKNPFLAGLLRSDSIHLGSNISFDDLAPLSSYLGKPGDPAKGGIKIDEYKRRQVQHEKAEIAALLDAPHFIERARELYEISNFICDSGGSICEVVDPENENDPVLSQLSNSLLLVWIKGCDEHTNSLISRFDAAPKPMCYRTKFMVQLWSEYLSKNNTLADDVDPNQFMRWAFAQAIEQRQPRYAAMAKNWGITVSAQDVAAATTPAAFDAMIANALEKHHT
ncbi:MAG: ATPase [Paracoccaceae bacterium]